MYSLQYSQNLEQKLFPWWIHRESINTLKSLSHRNDSKGIVICIGNGHTRLALVALEALQLIGNKLPIEVMFSTSNDLSPSNQRLLALRFPEIQLADLSRIFNDSYLKLRDWEIKPVSVLASRFQHVLLMDANVLFLEKPTLLFENDLYLRTGSLFFYDRPVLLQNVRQWIRSLPIHQAGTIPRRTQESGVVLIDKGRVLLGLLSTCKLNEHEQRERATYKYLHGDKDAWWLGFHLVGMAYSFMPTFPAAIGQIQHRKVCGHILHFDQNYQPIWWNGGMFKNRYRNTYDILSIEGWLEEGRWILDTISCLINNRKKARSFNQHQGYLIDSYMQITKHIFNTTSGNQG
ncbi:unnamed protein product [Rotaria socialis]|uniref:Uncharacterized protein n=1 Tax=Rotaria socialis TaxID=392032 RepID=A0A818M0D9_9BILA|nr:unnamed protein product [Rotaria socialis]CAF4859192.1 unnamed protein product [Rotaria socialis]